MKELPLDTRNIYGQYLGAGSIGILLVFCCVFWMAGSTRRRREQAFLAMEQEYYEKVRSGSELETADELEGNTVRGKLVCCPGCLLDVVRRLTRFHRPFPPPSNLCYVPTAVVRRVRQSRL